MEPDGEEEVFRKKIQNLREIINEFAKENPKLSSLLMQLVDEIEADKERFMGKDITITINDMRYAAADMEIKKFADKWFVDFEDVRYEAYHFRNGEIANESKLKESADYAAYKAATPKALPKFRFRTAMIEDFREGLMAEISPLIA